MEKISISVLEYLGKVENGVLVLLSIVYDKIYYEATFYYNDIDLILTIDQNLESEIGEITNHANYPEILNEIIKKVVPYNDIINSLDPVDFGRWVDKLVELNVLNKDEIEKEG